MNQRDNNITRKPNTKGSFRSFVSLTRTHELYNPILLPSRTNSKFNIDIIEGQKASYLLFQPVTPVQLVLS